MAFHINTHDIPPLRCYGDALAYWSRIKPWRGDGDTNQRPLAGRNKRHMTIRRLNDGSIAMRLHGTDVVVYHTNETITLRAWRSASTDMFASRLTPNGVSTSFNNNLGRLVHLEQSGATMTYQMASSTVTLRRALSGWQAVNPAMFAPFIKYGVDMPKARAAFKKCGFDEFRAWLKAASALAAPQDNLKVMLYPADVVRHLRQAGESWEILRASVDVEEVRQAIYAVHECIRITEVTAVAGYDVRSIEASARRWRHLTQ